MFRLSRLRPSGRLFSKKLTKSAVLLIATVAIVLGTTSAAAAWWFRGTQFQGHASEFSSSDGAAATTVTPSAAGHDGMSTRLRYLAFGDWLTTSASISYGTVGQRSISWTDPDDCRGLHKIKVDGGWSSTKTSYC